MKIIQINTTVNFGSTGRIAEEIGKLLISKGHQSFIAGAREIRSSRSAAIAVGNKIDMLRHIVSTRLFDRHGFSSVRATKKLVDTIESINPDAVHLHNLHGYYLNIEVLFKFLKRKDIPIVWTLHDCWPFTGHCSYFSFVNCRKWRRECANCPNKKGYPRSWFMDRSRKNFHHKAKIFSGVGRMVLITPSRWLRNHLKHSFLSPYPVKVIHNGIDLETFKQSGSNGIKEKLGIHGCNMVLGVAGTWDRRKGLDDFIHLRRLLGPKTAIVLLGLNQSQLKRLPADIIGLSRTEKTEELSEFYAVADVFVNPTWVDNFPTTNIEALACGTPVVTYNTGGSPEAVDRTTGKVVEKGDVEGLATAIKKILTKGKDHYGKFCRRRAENLFNGKERYDEYYRLYLDLIEH